MRVAAAGACHSDLHIMEFPPGVVPWQLPFTLGHENAGWVAATGAGVTGLREGDAVDVYPGWGCRRCKPSRQGAENACQRVVEIGSRGGGMGRDGGLAEFLLVPRANYLVSLGARVAGVPWSGPCAHRQSTRPRSRWRRALERVGAGSA